MKTNTLKLLVILILLTGGCGKTKKQAVEPEWKTDKAPIEKQFMNVKSIESVFWKGGVVGGQQGRLSVPGPSDYYLKGFMIVSQEEAEKWEKDYAWEPPKDSSQTPQDFPSEIPADTQFQWSREFEEKLYPRKFQGLILFSPKRQVVYYDLIDMGMISPGK